MHTYKHYMRSPRTTAEKRANQGRKYVRGKRLSANLPDTYDDMPIFSQKSWKKKRKKQYRAGKRGRRHEYFLPAKKRYGFCWHGRVVWRFEKYCERNDIPCVIEDVYEPYIYTRVHTKMKRTVGTTLVWWSDKDIGLEYILKSFGVFV